MLSVDSRTVLTVCSNSQSRLSHRPSTRSCTAEYGVNYTGTALASFPNVQSAYECANICVRLISCRNFRFNTFAGICDLVDLMPNGSVLDVPSVVSGSCNLSRPLPNQSPPRKTCSHQPGDLFQGDLKSIPNTASVDECIQQCILNDRCAAFSYLGGEGCYLKVQADNPSPVGGYTSGVCSTLRLIIPASNLTEPQLNLTYGTAWASSTGSKLSFDAKSNKLIAVPSNAAAPGKPTPRIA
jgi:hypothetical protein